MTSSGLCGQLDAAMLFSGGAGDGQWGSSQVWSLLWQTEVFFLVIWEL